MNKKIADRNFILMGALDKKALHFCDDPLSGRGMKENNFSRARRMPHKEAVDSFTEMVNENPTISHWSIVAID